MMSCIDGSPEKINVSENITRTRRKRLIRRSPSAGPGDVSTQMDISSPVRGSFRLDYNKACAVRVKSELLFFRRRAHIGWEPETGFVATQSGEDPAMADFLAEAIGVIRGGVASVNQSRVIRDPQPPKDSGRQKLKPETSPTGRRRSALVNNQNPDEGNNRTREPTRKSRNAFRSASDASALLSYVQRRFRPAPEAPRPLEISAPIPGSFKHVQHIGA